jgi:Zn-dependent peptidase ImmA (M78 family)
MSSARQSSGTRPRRSKGPFLTLRPEVLRWAREYRRRTTDEVAVWLSCEVRRVEILEETGGPISAAEFERLAKNYKLPQSTLAAPRVPVVPDVPQDFRTIHGNDPRLSLQTLAAIAQVQAWQQIAAELVASDLPEVAIPVVELSANPYQAGAAERERLRISDDEQLQLSDPPRLFAYLRKKIERQHVAVYVVPFGKSDNVRGVSDWSQEVPAVIAVNIKEAEWTARSFTLLHEYGHLLLRRPGISDENNRNRVEAWCNRFAAAALMPEGLVRASLDINSPGVTASDVNSGARRLGVSAQAFALRLEELGIAPEGFFRQVVSVQGRRARAKAGGSYVNTQVFSLARNYQGAVMTALSGGRIDSVGASRLLNLSPRHFGAVRAAIDR